MKIEFHEKVRKAKEAGYDAVSFAHDSDVGTVVLNNDAFIRNVTRAAK